jgi:hypothetical protein
VRVSIVARVANQLDVSGAKLGFKARGPSEFRSAHGSEITRVHEDATPRVSEILVEVKAV